MPTSQKVILMSSSIRRLSRIGEDVAERPELYRQFVAERPALVDRVRAFALEWSGRNPSVGLAALMAKCYGTRPLDVLSFLRTLANEVSLRAEEWANATRSQPGLDKAVGDMVSQFREALDAPSQANPVLQVA
jgi:hypothetical protein